jgi:hypothetical protein
MAMRAARSRSRSESSVLDEFSYFRHVVGLREPNALSHQPFDHSIESEAVAVCPGVCPLALGGFVPTFLLHATPGEFGSRRVALGVRVGRIRCRRQCKACRVRRDLELEELTSRRVNLSKS